MVGDTLLIYSALCGEPPAANAAAFTTRNSHPVLGFDDTTSESMNFSGVMPENYSGGGLTVWIGWTAGTAFTITEAGDTGNYVATWVLAGYSNSNSNGFVWYWNLTVSGTNYTVSLYSDLAKTQLVAQGTRTGVGSITLAAQNGSGLSGSVAVSGTPVADTDAANLLSANRVQWGVTFERDQNNVTDIDADAWATEYLVYDAPPVVTGTLRYITMVFTNAQIAGITAGDVFRFRIARKSGITPNVTGDAQIKTIEIRES